jgi:hypothetical protein
MPSLQLSCRCVVLALLVTILSSCDLITTTCARPGIASIEARVRNQFGAGTAIGATAFARRGTYELSAEGFADSVSIFLEDGRNETGVFELFVSKPFHQSVDIRPVFVPGDECGVITPKAVDVTLALLPGAPPVRQVFLSPYAPHMGCTNTRTIRVHVEADDSVSKNVLWLSRDTAVAKVSDAQLSCGGRQGTTYVLALAEADPSVRDSLRVSNSVAQP